MFSLNMSLVIMNIVLFQTSGWLFISLCTFFETREKQEVREREKERREEERNHIILRNFIFLPNQGNINRLFY